MSDPYGLVLPRVKELRMRQAMTQLELARAAGVSRATINRAEAGGTISMENTRKIAVALGVPVGRLQESEANSQ